MIDPTAVTAGVLAVVGVVAAVTITPWISMLAHELAHAVAVVLLRGRVLSGHVGAGAHVWPVRWFGARWELRWRPTHGIVHFVLPPGRFRRVRMLAVLLAGPAASTTVAALGWIALFALGGVFPADSSPALGVACLVVGVAAMVCSLLALQAWLPTWIRMPNGDRVLSDVKQALQLPRTPPIDPAKLAAAQALLLAAHEQWEAFLAGDYRKALKMHGETPRYDGDEVPHLTQQALYVWPIEGAAAALRLVETALDRFPTWAQARLAATADRGAATAIRDYLDELQVQLRTNRAFFGAVAGDPELLRRADRHSRELVVHCGHEPAALRTRGLIDLQLGNVREGMNLLRRAWRMTEPAYLRSLCALYLAYGHALRGDVSGARRMQRRARRLHPQNLMLQDIGARIDALHAAARSAVETARSEQALPPDATRSRYPHAAMTTPPRRTVSPERKGAYGLGLALAGVGLLVILICFVGFATAGQNAVRTFGQQGSPFGWWLGIFAGMVLVAVGAGVRRVAARGVAGSGLTLDPERAQKDLEPWARMGGGMLKDALDEAGVGKGGVGEGDGAADGGQQVMVRCRECRTLNDEAAKFCDQCGKAL
ncbi:MAG: site-2 protease family protein [Planctomycetota bacterium]